MVYRISVTGIDGAGKDSTISDLISSMSTSCTIAKIGRPTYIEQNGKRQYLFRNVNAFVDGTHSLFDHFSSRTGILLANGLNVCIQPSLERLLINKYNPDIVIAGRDMTLCPSVYLTYYLPSSKSLSSELRLSLFDSFRGLGYPDRIFYLDVEPKVADQRITERIEKESKGFDTDRTKWRHMHENPHDLNGLRQYYLEAVGIIEKSGVDVVRISTTNRPRDEVVDEMNGSLEHMLQGQFSKLKINLRGATASPIPVKSKN
jgi:thymidylate kinase